MEFIVVYPEPANPDLARTLDMSGYRWKAVSSPEQALEHEPTTGWAGAVVLGRAQVRPAGRPR